MKEDVRKKRYPIQSCSKVAGNVIFVISIYVNIFEIFKSTLVGTVAKITIYH